MDVCKEMTLLTALQQRLIYTHLYTVFTIYLISSQQELILMFIKR